jgi:NADH-quinone oxidoreductase subunit J
MVVQALAFYVFAAVLIGAGIMVVVSKNPVHSVLFLILAFFNAAGLFVMMGAEFLAMILVIVYVGAVAVLFLFVVMMLDVNFTELREGFARYLPIGLVIGVVLLIELIVLVSGVIPIGKAEGPVAKAIANQPAGHNTEMIGRLLYTDYFYLFQAAGMVLLVAMIGAIVLTHRRREGVRRQSIARQTARKPGESIRVVDVKPGEGL